MKKRNRGFSLFEVLVVIALVGILSAIAVPQFLRSKEQRVIRGLAENLAADLQLARMQALRSGTVSVVFTDNSYEIFTDGNMNYTADGKDQVLRSVDFPEPIRFKNNTFSNTRMRFNSRGLPDDTTGKVTISGNNSEYDMEVELNRVGKTQVTY